MATTICTFNANNLYVRYRFGAVFPGDRSDRSRVEDSATGYLPVYDPDLMTLFNTTQRDLAARVLTNDRTAFPDVICMQEVESMIALRRFNEQYLGAAYPYGLVVDSRDFRQIDVAILSKHEIVSVRTHVDEPDTVAGRGYLFSRDCLEVQLVLPANRRLTLFINHLKSKYAESAEDRVKGDKLRERQAERVAEIVKSRFPGSHFDEALFVVVGDFNDEPESPSLKPLVKDLNLTDALAAIPNESDRWTYWWRSENEVGQLDYLLLSPALASAVAGTAPRIERRGVGFARVLADGSPGPHNTTFRRRDDDPNRQSVGFQFERFVEVSPADYASDHCPVFLTVP